MGEAGTRPGRGGEGRNPGAAESQYKRKEREGRKTPQICSLPEEFSPPLFTNRETRSARRRQHTPKHTITKEGEGGKGGEKQQACAYFTLWVNGNKIPWWMSADVFDTNSHFPICCLIEHDEWWESERRLDEWQHLGSIACPIDSPSLLLLQPSWLLLPSLHSLLSTPQRRDWGVSVGAEVCVCAWEGGLLPTVKPRLLQEDRAHQWTSTMSAHARVRGWGGRKEFSDLWIRSVWEELDWELGQAPSHHNKGQRMCKQHQKRDEKRLWGLWMEGMKRRQTRTCPRDVEEKTYSLIDL